MREHVEFRVLNSNNKSSFISSVLSFLSHCVNGREALLPLIFCCSLVGFAQPVPQSRQLARRLLLANDHGGDLEVG